MPEAVAGDRTEQHRPRARSGRARLLRPVRRAVHAGGADRRRSTSSPPSTTRRAHDPEFLDEFDRLLRDYAGRPSLLTEAKRFAEHAGGARVFLKREDLNHTGSHKINNVLGQALLTKRMGKKRVIAETGAGQHGVATATACALLDLDCVVYMGEVDTERQALNVARMRLLGAEVIPVKTGSRTLKDAINEALRDWVTNVDDHALPVRHGRRPGSRSR